VIPAFAGKASEHNYSGQLRGWAGPNNIFLLDGILGDIAASLPTAGGAPVDVTKAAAAAGASTAYARADHKHDITTAAPGSVTLTSITATEGTATTLARSDHGHSIAAIAALTVLANATNAVAVPTAFAATADGQVFQRSGTTLTWGTIGTTSITNSSVTYAKIQNGTGLSVVGRNLNTPGANADIIGVDGQALRVAGTTLGFGTLATAAYADNSVTLAKLATQAALSVLANATNATAVPTAVAAPADGQVFLRSGTTLTWGTVGAVNITNTSITLAKLANGTACTVLGRAANSAGAYADIPVPTNDHVLMRTTNVVTSGFIANANVATAAAIAGTKINPDFGAQTIIGTLSLAIGVNPASSAKTIRIPNNGSVAARNFANSVDVSIAAVNTTDQLLLGDSASTATIVTSGGTVNIRPGGNTVAVFGNTYLSIGDDTAGAGIIRLPNNTGINFRNVAGSADIPAVTVDNSNTVFFGSSSGAETVVRAATAIYLRLASTDAVTVSTGAVDLIPQTIRWASSVSAPEIAQFANPTNGVTATNMYVTAQRATGTGSTGGDLVLSSGIGTASNGVVRLLNGSDSIVNVFPGELNVNGTLISFTNTKVNPGISHGSISTATFTSGQLSFVGQDCSGTTSVTAGTVFIRSGDANGGSGTRNGGSLQLRSGTGATSDGDVTISRGLSAVLSATSTAVSVGNSSVLVEGVSIGGRSIVALCRGSALTATQMPTNSGSGVIYVAQSSAIPSANPVNGYTIYADGTGIYVRGPSGSITQLGIA
jgi:hypothetical protein